MELRILKQITSGVNGGAFVGNITPQNPGDNVSDKVYASDGITLRSCLSNTNLITVSVVAIVGNTKFIPTVTVNGNVVSLSGSVSNAVLTGTINIDTGGATSLTVVHEDGAQNVVNITYDVGPEVTSAVFGSYPGSQTQLKAGDVINLRVQTDSLMTRIYVYDIEACIYQIFSFPAVTDKTVSVVIANRGTSTQSLRAKVKCMNSNNSYGSDAWSDTVDLNNTYPGITFGAIVYSLFGALKDSETATVVNVVTDYNTLVYSSPNGELSVTNPTTFENPKTVTRIAGTYNITNNNLRISANRVANDATTVSNSLVKIAHTACTISVSVPYSRLRSGGNDGTTAQDYWVTITPNQQLYQAPTLNLGVGGGTWLGGGFTVNGSNWRRQVRIDDDDVKGDYSFNNLSAINLAGKETTVISSGASYTLGGFVIRTLILEAFANTTIMNVAAVTYPSKVSMIWTVKSLPTKATVGTTAPPPVSGAWCVGSLNTNPTTITILDTEATNASSTPTTLTVEETV